MNLTLKEIFRYLEATPVSRCINEGECLVNASHIITCGKVEETDEKINIYALCLQTSALNSIPHEINGIFQISNGQIIINSMSCSCKAGSGCRCKHIAAVLIYCTRISPTNLEMLSTTDVKCVWTQRKQAVSQKYRPLPILESDCFKTKVPKEVKISEKEFERHWNLLKQYAPSNSAFMLYSESKHMKIEITKQFSNLPAPLVETLFENASNRKLVEYVYNLDMPYLLSCCVNSYNNFIVPESIDVLKDLLIKTIENEQLWQKHRQFRITGSRCYNLYTYKGTDWHSKIMKFFWPKKFTNKYVEHGIEQEKNARETYGNLFNVTVYKLGLFISQTHPWVGYSADGVVYNGNKLEKLVEIKCPFLGKSHTVSDILKDCKFLIKINNIYFLREKHSYYAQIQLGMSLLNMESCDFVIFSSFDSSVHIINIKHNMEFSKKLLGRLKNIYFSKMLHYICENRDYIVDGIATSAT